MPRESPHFDRARALAGQLLALEAELDELELDGLQKVELLKARAALEGALAIAEALRGVVYTANANAV